jgi:hypothetical protein
LGKLIRSPQAQVATSYDNHFISCHARSPSTPD